MLTWNRQSDRHHTTTDGVWAATLLRNGVWRLTYLQPDRTPAGDYRSLADAKRSAEALTTMLARS